MHQQTITLEELAGLQQGMQVFGSVDEGPVLTTIGKHPRLGSCIVLHASTTEPLLISERPWAEAADDHRIPAIGQVA
jgi:hypothetical protein